MGTGKPVNSRVDFEVVLDCSAMSLVWIKGKLHKNNGYMILYESFWSTKNSVNNIFGFDAVFYCSAMSLVWIEGSLFSMD